MEEKDIYSLVSAFKRLNYTIGFLDFACFGREHGMRFGDVEENIDDDIFLTENGYDSFSDYIIINGVKALSETEEALSSLMNYNKGIIERSLDRGFRCMEFENLIKTAREFSEMLNGGIDFTNIFRSCILNGLKVDFVGMISKMTIVANYCRQLCELYDYHTAHTPEADTTPTQAHAKQPTAQAMPEQEQPKSRWEIDEVKFRDVYDILKWRGVVPQSLSCEKLLILAKNGKLGDVVNDTDNSTAFVTAMSVYASQYSGWGDDWFKVNLKKNFSQYDKTNDRNKSHKIDELIKEITKLWEQ